MVNYATAKCSYIMQSHFFKSADSDTPPLPLLPVPSACMGTRLARIWDAGWDTGGILNSVYPRTWGSGDQGPEEWGLEYLQLLRENNY